MTTRKKLCNIKGISEAKVDKIKVGVLSDNFDSNFSQHLCHCCIPSYVTAKLCIRLQLDA